MPSVLPFPWSWRLLDAIRTQPRAVNTLLLSVFAERRLAAGQNADIGSLMQDLTNPPIAQDWCAGGEFVLEEARTQQPSSSTEHPSSITHVLQFGAKGTSLDIADWVAPKNGFAHRRLSSASRTWTKRNARSCSGVLLEEILSWGAEGCRAPSASRPSSSSTRSNGFLPTTLQSTTKRPIVALMKQARAFGVGVVVRDAKPMDLDYRRALGMPVVWCIGRLQTDADRARGLDGLAGSKPKRRGFRGRSRPQRTAARTKVVIIKNAHEAFGRADPASPAADHVAHARHR